MALTGVLRAAYVQVRVTDLAAAMHHYRDILGLHVVAEQGTCVYLKAWDEFDHHSVILRLADTPGMDRMGFKVASEHELERLATALVRAGVAIDDLPAGHRFATGRCVSFVAPTGHRFDLFATTEQVGNGLPTINPDVSPDDLSGIAPSAFDHCLLYGDDLDGTVQIFCEILGFHMTEQIVAKDGRRIGAFLACSNKTHDLALIRHPDKGKLHHISFYVGEWSSIERAADLLCKRDVKRDIGPTKHGISRGSTIYFFDPAGNRNEVFAGGYLSYPDRPTITWTEDELGKAIFYYERALNERFLTVMT